MIPDLTSRRAGDDEAMRPDDDDDEKDVKKDPIRPQRVQLVPPATSAAVHFTRHILINLCYIIIELSKKSFKVPENS